MANALSLSTHILCLEVKKEVEIELDVICVWGFYCMAKLLSKGVEIMNCLNLNVQTYKFTLN